MKKINYLFILVLTIVVASCEPKYEKEYSWAYPVAGDWTVAAYVDGVVVPGYEKFEIKSYNSAFGQDSIWIDDYGTSVTKNAAGQITAANGHFWTMKFKVAVDMANKTFKSENSKNVIPNYGIAIKVTNGKVVGSDSISMEVEFGDEPGTIYRVAGHRTTSYDEYMGH